PKARFIRPLSWSPLSSVISAPGMQDETSLILESRSHTTSGGKATESLCSIDDHPLRRPPLALAGADGSRRFSAAAGEEAATLGRSIAARSAATGVGDAR